MKQTEDLEVQDGGRENRDESCCSARLLPDTELEDLDRQDHQRCDRYGELEDGSRVGTVGSGADREKKRLASRKHEHHGSGAAQCRANDAERRTKRGRREHRVLKGTARRQHEASLRTAFETVNHDAQLPCVCWARHERRDARDGQTQAGDGSRCDRERQVLESVRHGAFGNGEAIGGDVDSWQRELRTTPAAKPDCASPFGCPVEPCELDVSPA